MRKRRRYWTASRILTDARRFHSRSEWKENSAYAYRIAIQSGIHERATSHMPKPKMGPLIWTREKVLGDAGRYKTLEGWRKGSNVAYQSSFRLGIHQDATQHMRRGLHSRYSKREIHEGALKYRSRKEFRERAPSLYDAAHYRGILDDVCRHMRRPHWIPNTAKPRSVYALEFIDGSAYVGISLNPRFRIADHFRANRRHRTVRDRIDSLGGVLPTIRIRARGLTPKQSQVAEERAIRWYAQAGWTILNRTRAGSLGSARPYTDRELRLIARKYESKYAWQMDHAASYQAARRRGMLARCCSHMEPRYRKWSLQAAVDQLKTYPNRDRAQRKSSRAFQIVRQAGLLDEVLPKRRPLSLEKAISIGRIQQSLTEWARSHPGSYDLVRRAGLLRTVLRPRDTRKWTLERALGEGEKYKNRQEWKVAQFTSYNLVREAGRLDEVVPRTRNRWTIESAMHEGKRFASRKHWQVGNGTTYNIVRKAGRLDEVMPSWRKTARLQSRANVEG